MVFFLLVYLCLLDFQPLGFITFLVSFHTPSKFRRKEQDNVINFLEIGLE